MTWDRISAELAKPLDRKNVKERRQSGTTLSYIEGWHAIAEANRIFGFDAWTRETLEMRCVAENPRKVGRDGVAGFGVSYVAKVRVIVNGVAREGYGTGHGIDRDLGAAHESAVKEAETDAMKRAFMTFGNPFGLALYDKTQANVADGVDENPPAPETQKSADDPFEQTRPPASAYAMKKYTPEAWDDFIAQLRATDTASGLALLRTEWRKEIGGWPAEFRNTANAEFDKHKAEILARLKGEKYQVATEVWGDDPPRDLNVLFGSGSE